MTVEFNESSYIVGMWFSSCPKTLNNWLAGIVRDPENDKKYKGWSRFRYAKGNKIFNSEDEKIWTEFTSQENENEQSMIDFMRNAQRTIKEGYPEADEIIVNGDIHKLFELSKDKAWMHMKIAKINGLSNE